MHEETLKSLESLRDIPVSLRGLNYLMKGSSGACLTHVTAAVGFTIELFFLAVRQLSSRSSSSELELTKVFYTGTFEVIISLGEEQEVSRDAANSA